MKGKLYFTVRQQQLWLIRRCCKLRFSCVWLRWHKRMTAELAEVWILSGKLYGQNLCICTHITAIKNICSLITGKNTTRHTVHNTIPKQNPSWTTICSVIRLNTYQKEPFILSKHNFTSNMNYWNNSLRKEKRITISIPPLPLNLKATWVKEGAKYWITSELWKFIRNIFMWHLLVRVAMLQAAALRCTVHNQHAIYDTYNWTTLSCIRHRAPALRQTNRNLRLCTGYGP
jgi:hypothetical protein